MTKQEGKRKVQCIQYVERGPIGNKLLSVLPNLSQPAIRNWGGSLLLCHSVERLSSTLSPPHSQDTVEIMSPHHQLHTDIFYQAVLDHGFSEKHLITLATV